MAKLCLALGLLCSLVFADTDPQWEAALKFLQEAKPAEAIPLLETWLTQAEAKGIRSPEAHHNLALAYGQTENWGPAVFHFATSASLRDNPLYLGEALATLSRIQNRLLIQDAVSAHWAFRLALFLGRGLLLGIAVVGLWILLSAFVFPSARRPLVLAGLAILLLAAVGFAARVSLPQFAVVVAGAAGAPLTAEPPSATAKKLVDIPSGALVALNLSQDEAVRITQPFAGWVPANALRPLAF